MASTTPFSQAVVDAKIEKNRVILASEIDIDAAQRDAKDRELDTALMSIMGEFMRVSKPQPTKHRPSKGARRK